MTLTRWYRGCTMVGMQGAKARRCGGAAAVVIALTLFAAACATNPVTGKKQMSLLSEADELAIGQQQDVEIRREMGVYDDPALQRYVSDIGQELARASHRPNLRWTFTVIDSPAINAFALPGGYVYVTRGILAYLDDESELAGVLGHEIGHVTARHAAQAYTRQMQANLGLTVLSIFVPGTAPFADLGATGLGVLFLRNGREAEIEADRLGVEYGSGAGYDPCRGAAIPVDARAGQRAQRARHPQLAVDPSRSWFARHEGRAGGRPVRLRRRQKGQSRSVSRTHPRTGRRRQSAGRHRARQRVSAPAASHRRDLSRRLGADQHRASGAGAGARDRTLHGAAGSGAPPRGGQAARGGESRQCDRPATPSSTGSIERINGNEAHVGRVSRQRQGHRQGDDARGAHRDRAADLRGGGIRPRRGVRRSSIATSSRRCRRSVS